MTSPDFYLASTSPRRQELLKTWGYSFELIKPQVDESRFIDELPTDYVQRVALEKSLHGWYLLGDQLKPFRPVLGADTIVCTRQNKILGKPVDKEEARYFLSLLSGTSHLVYTAVCITDVLGLTHLALSTSEVTFKQLSKEIIDQYVETREPLDKAGAYGIQGKASAFVEKVEGSLTGVIGLPENETVNLLRLTGIRRKPQKAL